VGSERGPGSDPDRWLERVYSADTADELVKAYDAWAATYDTDMLAIGYANPAVAVGLVARHVPAIDACILDAGVGTGILGELLSILGYRNLVGIDMSEGMLAKARKRKVYSELRNRVLGEPLDFGDGAFAAVVSFGVFTPGHAPAVAFDELVRITRPGGHLIFTVSTAAWKAGDFREKLRSLEQAGRIRAVASTDTYQPMPLSQTESTFTTRAFVYTVL
jgi:SAM-dependent methyltransferase